MRMLSADGHIDLPYISENLFFDAAPPAMRDRVPQLAEPGKWTYKGAPLFRTSMGVPVSRVTDRMKPTGIFENIGVRGLSRPSTPKLRKEDQDRDGVEGDVIYGLLGIDLFLKDDPEALRFCLQAYYKWIAEFVKAEPGRFAALGPVCGADPYQAADDVFMMKELGLAGFELRPRSASKPFWHDDWAPLWEAATKAQMPVHFHSDIGRLVEGGKFVVPTDDPRAPHYQKVTAALIGSIGKMANAEHLGTIILSGVLDRYPDLTLVMGESDLSWIPHFLERMDYCVTEREHSTGLSMLPSEFWRRQCKATFQYDKVGVSLVEILGEDNIMWGNDYPHPDGVWPNSQNVAVEHGVNLSEAQRHKIFFANTAKLYGLGETAEIKSAVPA